MPYDEAMRAGIVEGKCAVPSLFIWGTSDELVPAERSKQLSAAFDAAGLQSYEHAGAHMVRCLCIVCDD